MTSIAAAHGGRLPANAQLTQHQAEQLDATLGGALEALAQIPGRLEVEVPPRPAPIPSRGREDRSMKPTDRRTFLTRSAAVLGAGALGGGAALARGSADAEGTTAPEPSSGEEWDVAQAQLGRGESFDGEHQAGILTPAQAQATFVALDSIAADRVTLQVALQALSNRARELVAGRADPRIGGRRATDPARARRAADRLGDPRARQRARRADRHDRVRSVAVRRSLRARREASAASWCRCRPSRRRPRPGNAATATCCCRSAPTSATPSPTRCASCCEPSAAPCSCAGCSTASERRTRTDAAQQPPQPVRLPRRDREPADRRRGADGPARCGRARRARLGGRRHLPGGARDPHARRVLGPRRAHRAGT